MKLLPLICVVILASTACSTQSTVESVIDKPENTSLPYFEGLMTFHSYSTYEAGDSKMYIYNFKSNELKQISRTSWNIFNPMNGHFSPDGRFITFMGIGSDTGSWDIFLYDVLEDSKPVNLTPDGAFRDEDPKFSSDGKSIIFKRNEHLAKIDMDTRRVSVITPDKSGFSMPYYSTDGNSVVYSGGGNDSFIGLYDLNSGTDKIIYNRFNVHEYYPITLDKDRFYYSAGYSENNRADQLYLGYFSGLVSKRLPFNTPEADYSDAAPVDEKWLILCSTRDGGQGQYDLYMANNETGEIYSMDDYNVKINSRHNELGASYVSTNPFEN